MQPSSGSRRSAPPTLTRALGWLTFWIISWCAAAAFGFRIPAVEDAGPRGGLVAAFAMAWAAIGWMPAVLVWRQTRARARAVTGASGGPNK